MGGRGFGVVFDIVLGLAGALVGGLVFGLLRPHDGDLGGDAGFWGSLVVAFLGGR